MEKKNLYIVVTKQEENGLGAYNTPYETFEDAVNAVVEDCRETFVMRGVSEKQMEEILADIENDLKETDNAVCDLDGWEFQICAIEVPVTAPVKTKEEKNDEKVFLVYETDAWHSNASKTLIDVYKSMECAINRVIFELKDADYFDENDDEKDCMDYVVSCLESSHQTSLSNSDVNYIIEAESVKGE